MRYVSVQLQFMVDSRLEKLLSRWDTQNAASMLKTSETTFGIHVISNLESEVVYCVLVLINRIHNSKGREVL